MADKREIKVTAEDIQAVNEKLRKFAKDLPPGEQNVMAWLLGRAADAPSEKPDFLPAEATGRRPAPGGPPRRAVAREPLNAALGIPQFEKLRPGSAAAGSSIGVTGTIMF